MTMAYVFHTDPGHGWLAVKRAELSRLGILNKITPYSYQKGGTVYLEEDCDAGTFLEAKKLAGEEVSFRESHQERTPIRHYPQFNC
jgi:hypothetical protein